MLVQFPPCWFYFSSPELKLSKFCLSFTPDAALDITHPRASPLSLPLLHFFFSLLRQRKEKWRSVDWCVCGFCEHEEDEESRLWSVTVSLLCSVFLSLSFTRLVQSRGVWPPQSIFSIPACPQLVSSDRRLLISPHGVRVRHEPFSLHHAVKLQLTLEKHF